MSQIHVAVTRVVKPGRESEFEAAVSRYLRESMHEPGTTSAHLLKPQPASDVREYGILRSFQNWSACEAFYRSSRFKEWEKAVTPFVIGPPKRRHLHGLEGFFRGNLNSPPRWKMALITWVGVFPTALLWSSFLPGYLNGWPKLLVSAVINVFVVATLAWVAMPFLTRVFSFWLHPSSSYRTELEENDSIWHQSDTLPLRDRQLGSDATDQTEVATASFGWPTRGAHLPDYS
ncbi:MAG: antibiotic biosynthesis monooxygenase [Gemmataceae bacterium]